MIAVLEQHMQGRDFVVGGRVTVADFNAAFTLDWANEEGLLDDAPALRTYLKAMRSEEHTSELQSLMRISYAVFCLKKKRTPYTTIPIYNPLPDLLSNTYTHTQQVH